MTFRFRSRAIALARFALAATAALVFAPTCAEGPTAPETPPTPPETLVLTSLVNRTLVAGDTLVFELETQPDEVVLISLQSESGDAADTLKAIVQVSGVTAVLDSVFSAGTQATLHDVLLQLDPSPLARTLRISVLGTSPDSDGAFRMMVQGISEVPEAQPALLPLAAPVIERIHVAGDIDEFVLSASPSVWYYLELSAPVGFPDTLTAQVLNGAAVVAALRTSAPAAGDTTAPARFTLPSAGVYAVRVFSGSAGNGSSTGGYALRVDSVSKLTMHNSVARPLGAGETHEYRISVPADSTVLVSLQGQSGMAADTVDLEVRVDGDSALVDGIASVGTQPRLNDGLTSIGSFGAPTVLAVRVRHRNPTHTGPYQVRFQTQSTKPEHGHSTAPPSTIVREGIDVPGDVDRFPFTVVAGNAYGLRVGALAPFSDTLSVRVLRGDSTLAQIRTNATQPDVFTLAPQMFVSPTNGTVYIDVRSGAAGSTGPYEMRIEPIPPSSSTALFNIPSTATDSLNAANWIDNWQIGWSPSSQLRLTMEALSGSASDTLLVVARRTIAPFDSVASFVAVGGGGPAHFDVPIRPPNSGFAGLRLYARAAQLTQGGSYSLSYTSVWPSTPETVGASRALGDTIAGEWLEDPGDVDVYAYSVAPGMQAVLFAAVDSSVDNFGLNSLIVTLRDSSNALVSTLPLPASPSELHTTARRLTFTAGGTVTMQAGGALNGPLKYRLVLDEIDTLPETASPVLAIGDTATEWIDNIGDIDEFEIPGTPGDTVSVRIAVENVLPRQIQVEWRTPEGGSLASTWTAGGQTTLDEFYLRVTILDDGTARVRLTGGLGSTLDSSRTSYRIEALRITSAPESVSQLVAIGDSIVGESIDRPGDIDEFHLEVDSTRWTDVVLRATRALESDVIVAAANDELITFVAGPLSVDSAVLSAPLALNAPGPMRLVVYSNPGATMPYTLSFRPIDPRPEVVSDTVELGEWIEGETLHRSADLDRFIVATDMSNRHAFEIETQPGAVGGFVLLTENGAVKSGAGALVQTPLSATSTVRFQGFSVAADRSAEEGPGLGAYRFRIRAARLGPEVADSVLVIGDTITTEGIDNPADEDHFVFTPVFGKVYRIEWKTLGPDPESSLIVRVQVPLTFDEPIGSGGESSIQFTASSSQAHRLRLSPANAEERHVTPYRLVIRELP
jgi:hypothetical protein